MKKLLKICTSLLLICGLTIVGVLALQTGPATLTTTGTISFESQSAYVAITGTHFIGATVPEQPTYTGKTYTVTDGRIEAQNAAQNWSLGTGLALTEENFTLTISMTFTNEGVQPVTISVALPQDIESSEITLASWRGGLEEGGGDIAESVLQGNSVTFTYILELQDPRYSFTAQDFSFIVSMTSVLAS